MTPGEFEYQLDLQKQLSSCPNVRAVVDTVKASELSIFPFLAGDLVGKMANLDPTRRITAREALQHRWFSQAW